MDNRPIAVLFDRDGSLASVHNGPFKTTKDLDSKGYRAEDAQWKEFNAALRFDRPVPMVVALLNAIRPGVVRIMVSGRAEGDWPGDRRRRWAMEDWICKHQLPIDELFMREGGDKRLDSIIKEEILLRDILPRFNPVVAVDDRDVVLDVWKRHGLVTIKVVNPATLPMIGS